MCVCVRVHVCVYVCASMCVCGCVPSPLGSTYVILDHCDLCMPYLRKSVQRESSGRLEREASERAPRPTTVYWRRAGPAARADATLAASGRYSYLPWRLVVWVALVWVFAFIVWLRTDLVPEIDCIPDLVRSSHRPSPWRLAASHATIAASMYRTGCHSLIAHLRVVVHAAWSCIATGCARNATGSMDCH